jgi:hypothetical protein
MIVKSRQAGRHGADALLTDPQRRVGTGWLARTSCRVAGHIGDWTYPDAPCVRVRRCKRCGEVTSKQEHAWSAFGYVATGRCEQERRCDRCGAMGSRVLHSWGPWLYVGPDDSELVRQSHTCGRCGAEEHTRYFPAF